MNNENKEYREKELFLAILKLIGSFILLANGLILLNTRISNIIGSFILLIIAICIYTYVIIDKLKSKKDKQDKRNIAN